MLLSPPKILKVLGLPLICAATFVVLGGHWAILQGVAWAQMTVEYSRTSGSVITGVQKTFSGKYPCAMCKRIAESQKKEDQAPANIKVDKKRDNLFLEIFASIKEPYCNGRLDWGPLAVNFPTRSDTPPSPIPIGTV